MNAQLEQRGTGRYRALFGYRAGYLPADFEALLDWQRAAEEGGRAGESGRARPADGRVRDRPGRLIAGDGIVRMYVDRMIGEVPEKDRTRRATSRDLLDQLDHSCA